MGYCFSCRISAASVGGRDTHPPGVSSSCHPPACSPPAYHSTYHLSNGDLIICCEKQHPKLQCYQCTIKRRAALPLEHSAARARAGTFVQLSRMEIYSGATPTAHPESLRWARHGRDTRDKLLVPRDRHARQAVQGDRDVRVKKDRSDRVVAALRARHAAVHHVVLEDEDHGLSRTESLLTAY